MEISEKKDLNKDIFMIVAVVIVFCAWLIYERIYCDVVPPPDTQITINAAKDEASDYKSASRVHGEAAKERSVNIYVQTAKDIALMAPDAVADGVVSELRIFAAELAGSVENSLSADQRGTESE